MDILDQTVLRRDFCRLFGTSAGVTAFALGLNAFAPAILQRKLIAAPPQPGKKKLVFIFQRGGMDAINAVIPRGDPNYSKKSRPTLFIEPDEAISLDGTDESSSLDASLRSFVQLHPSLEPMLEIYRAGDLAILHRVGYRKQSRSHFDSQRFYESGTTDPNLQEGMIYRHAAEIIDLDRNYLGAIGLSGGQIVALKGPKPIPVVRDIRTFRFPGSDRRNQKFLGRPPGGTDRRGRGILGAYGRSPDAAEKPYHEEVYRTGYAVAEVMSTLQRLDPDTYQPSNGATYPEGASLYFKAKQAAMLLKETPVQIVGMNIGGWDTHTKQGRLSGGFPDRLYQVAHVFRSLYRDLRDQWDDTIVVSLTEFGRTSKENGSRGTDHGEAIAMFVAGGAVRGGVYNAPNLEKWTSDGGVFSTRRGRYLKHWTDFRAVFAEIFAKHFGDDAATLEKVIPGYGKLVAEGPEEYRQLGFL